MNLVLAAKKRGNNWRGAFIVDGEFQDALFNESLSDMVVEAVGPALSAGFSEGQEINVTVTVRPIARSNIREVPDEFNTSR